MVEQNITTKLLGHIPAFYDKDTNSNNYKFFVSFASEIEDLNSSIEDLKVAIQVTTATGQYLDDIGELFLLRRNGNESDRTYRTRILTYWKGFTGGGTFESIRQSILNTGLVDENSFSITEIRPLVFQINIGITEELDPDLINQILQIINNIKAAGMYVTTTEYTSSNNMFRLNVSEVNGEDYIFNQRVSDDVINGLL